MVNIPHWKQRIIFSNFKFILSVVHFSSTKRNHHWGSYFQRQFQRLRTNQQIQENRLKFLKDALLFKKSITKSKEENETLFGTMHHWGTT